MNRIINFFINNSLLVNMIFAGIVFIGIITIFDSKREAFPRIDFNYVTVTAIYPGATAEDVEKHITIPLENKLREIDGIEDLFSTSFESRSMLVIKLDADISNKDKTINDIKNAVDKVEDYPTDAKDPVITELSTAQMPVLDISIVKKDGVNNDADEFELRKYSKMLEDRILDINGVARIIKQGYRNREMLVEINIKKLNEYHLGLNDVIFALARKNLNFPGGLIRESKEEILIRTVGEVKSAEDIRNVLIRANDIGNWVKISDVAVVRDSFEEEKLISKTEGIKAVTLTVLKKESSDIITLVGLLRKDVAEYKKTLPDNFKLLINNDISYLVKRRLDVLINNGIQGFILVLISLVLSYGWRISIFTALAIPFSLFITIIWMSLAGVTINLNSMFGLIMALGMLVDNNIVVADNIYRHLEEKWPLRQAVVKGSIEVLIPVAATVLTTIAAFAPLMFMSGIMGKFMWTLPAVLSVALLASWAESAFVLPVQIYDMQKRRKKAISMQEEEGGKFFSAIRKKYLNILTITMHNRKLFIIGVTVVFFGSVLFGVVKMKFILFPQGGIETFVIRAESPIGTSVQQMSKNLTDIEKIASKLPKEEVISFTSKAGILQESPTDPQTKQGANYGTMIIYLTPEEERKRVAEDIINDMREKTRGLKNFEKLEFSFIKNGPPTGKPVSVSIKGDDIKILKEIADKYKARLKTIPGLKDIKDDYETEKGELRVIVNEAEASIAGINVFDVASTIRICYDGNIATSIKKTDEKIDIRVILPKSERDTVESIRNIKISNRMGNLVPLSSIARIEKTTGVAVINRKDWRRIINVTADIDEKAKDVTSVTVNRMLIKEFSEIETKYPGYYVNYEGEFKDTQESINNLMRSFIIAALAIYIILIAVFKSMIQPVIIMSIIPLSLIAVIWVFFLHGLPLSFLAIMGVVGLAGVVVNNSIVFVDFINISRAKGMSTFDAAIEAGSKRLRPIILSSITTVLGLMPTAYGIGGNDPFLKPMALSMAWGLAFGTVITLFVTPVLYLAFSGMRQRITKNELPIQISEPDPDEKERSESIKKEIFSGIKNEFILMREELKKEIFTDLLKKNKGKNESASKAPKKVKN